MPSIKEENKSIEIVIDSVEMWEFKKNFIRKDGDKYECEGQVIRTVEAENIPVRFTNMKHTYELFSLLGNLWGNWNDCPDCKVMKQKTKNWYENYGAELIKISHDTLVFQCNRKLTENEVENLLEDISGFAPNSLDIAKPEIIKKKLAEDGEFVLWWD